MNEPEGPRGRGTEGPRGPGTADVYARAAVVRVYDRRDRTVIIGPRGAQALDGDSAQLARAVLAQLVDGPATRAEILAHLAALVGAPIDDTTAVDQLLALLADAGVVHRRASDAPAAPTARATRPLRVVVCGTGAIGTAQLPALVLALQQRGHTVRVALTAEARRFVSAAALEALTHARIPADPWDGEVDAPVPHLALAEWAEVVVIAPASATTISRLATGDCSDLVAALALSARGPVLVAPSMNQAMLRAPAIARNIAQLAEDGFAIVHGALHGVEVAQDPGARTPQAGPSPPADVLVELVELLSLGG